MKGWRWLLPFSPQEEKKRGREGGRKRRGKIAGASTHPPFLFRPSMGRRAGEKGIVVCGRR